MLTAKKVPSVCLSCRLNLLGLNPLASYVRNAPTVRSARALRAGARSAALDARPWNAQRRAFTTVPIRRAEVQETEATPSNDIPPPLEAEADEVSPADEFEPQLSTEETVRRTRQVFGDALPRGYLKDEEYVVYERLYGEPVFVESVEDILGKRDGLDTEEIVEEELEDGTTVLLRKLKDGTYEEIEVFEEGLEGEEEEGLLAEEGEGEGEEGDLEGLDVERESMTKEEWQEVKERRAAAYHQDVYERSMSARDEALEEEQWQQEEEEDDGFMRAHPLTVAGRSRPSPSTVYLPKDTFVEPIAEMLTRANHKHLQESAHRIFGGPGLPNSASVASASLNKEQKPIPLDPSRSDMGNIESDVYLAGVMPGTYATVMHTLVEVRKRLGTPWINHLLNKKGGPMFLDAGSGGAGVLAFHEVLKAEWARMHEESGATSHGDAPLGKSTVLTASDTLRHRASKLLENTTFIPRLPEHETADQENEAQPRKLYDVIIAPHTLWPLKQEYMRKEMVEKYWSLLNPKGGVLILVEKGLPRGFEVIAAAREYLLEKHIASPDSTEIEVPLDHQVSNPDDLETRFSKKETGMIIAPCTNHSQCPMYKSPGISLGRKDFCFFSQRYIRPPFLQRILNATDRNHEDVQFSYIAVQRGRDQRLALHDLNGKGIVQDAEATDRAFSGHEWKENPLAHDEPHLVTPQDVNPLSLPRMLLPALKRRGHVTLDVCTPAGTLERWTVPRSFSKQAFRDARKAQWGDLWALGAKTRTPKNVRLGRPRDEFDKKGRRIKAAKKSQVINVDVSERGFEGFSPSGGKVAGQRATRVAYGRDGDRDGRYSVDRKIRGSGGRKGRKGGKTQGGIMDELD